MHCNNYYELRKKAIWIIFIYCLRMVSCGGWFNIHLNTGFDASLWFITQTVAYFDGTIRMFRPKEAFDAKEWHAVVSMQLYNIICS